MASGSVSQTLRPGDVVNNLTNTATDKPLSANMGRVISEQLYGGSMYFWTGSSLVSTITLPAIKESAIMVHRYGNTVAVYALDATRCNKIAGDAEAISTDGVSTGQTLTFPREGSNKIAIVYK